MGLVVIELYKKKHLARVRFGLKMPISSFLQKSRDEVYWGKCRQFNFLQKVQEKLSCGTCSY